MQNYDPEAPPNPAEWLALDEQLRIRLAEVYHRKACEKLPNLKAHAVFHAIVENQIAERLEPVVRAMARLMKQGLSRHDAVHAVGSFVADHFFEAMNSKDEHFGRTRYGMLDCQTRGISLTSSFLFTPLSIRAGSFVVGMPRHAGDQLGATRWNT